VEFSGGLAAMDVQIPTEVRDMYVFAWFSFLFCTWTSPQNKTKYPTNAFFFRSNLLQFLWSSRGKTSLLGRTQAAGRLWPSSCRLLSCCGKMRTLRVCVRRLECFIALQF
jgi:hypothetical protein